jgi:hypothetical protein
MVFEVLKGINPGQRVLVDKHLNFDVRYDLVDDIVTHKHYRFHTEHILPNIALCQHGKCDEDLCAADVEEFEVARVLEEPHYILWDETIGKKVLINGNGVVSFVHPDGDDVDIDLNWKRLQSMAKPIIDEQLSKIVMMKQWKKCNMRVDLGVLMLDNTVVRYHKQSCSDMVKDEGEDMQQCMVAWNRKLDIERRKRAMDKPADSGHSERMKERNFLTNLNFREREEMEGGTNNDIKPLMAGSEKYLYLICICI